MRPSILTATMTREMSAADYKLEVLKSMREREWQAQVVQFARHRGWLVYFTHRSDHSPAGFPDLCMVRAMPNGDRRIIFAELKSMRGKLQPNQREWLSVLGMVADVAKGHIEVYCWRPDQWSEVKARLM